VTGIISTLFHRPGSCSRTRLAGRPFYLWQIASTVGFVFLFSPEIAAIGVLLVVENEISNFGYMHQILYQYSIVLAPILALGVLYAIAQQSTLWRRNALAIVALTGAVWTCTLWGYAPFSDNSIQTQTVAPSSIGALNTLEKKIHRTPWFRRGTLGLPRRQSIADLCLAHAVLRRRLGTRD